MFRGNDVYYEASTLGSQALFFQMKMEKAKQITETISPKQLKPTADT